MLALDAGAVECRIFTFKEGALSALAHDLELRVTRLSLELEGQRRLRATFDARSLVVLHALRDGRPTTQLSAADRRKIEQTVTDDVLVVQRYPEIRFVGELQPVEGAAPRGAQTITGELTLHGRSRALSLRGEPHDGLLIVETTLYQPDYGIKPYSALLGALKIRPEVRVRLAAPWPMPT
jgi:polyisoprenoid-binding protein YceI